MGCVGSKEYDSAAIDLCRKRCKYLDEAIHQRYVLSEAHLGYFLSLKSVGDSLHRFFTIHSVPPSQLTKKSHPPASPASAAKHSRSNSGSSHLHFHFHSDDDSDDDSDSDDESLHLHSDHHIPTHNNDNNNNDDDDDQVGPYFQPDYNFYPPPAGGYTINYMRKQTTPCVVYQQKPINSEPIYHGEASTSSFYINNNNSNYGEFLGSNQGAPVAVVEAPPQASSGWGFLNPFESYYPPSMDSREEEGIPDLEDVDFHAEQQEEEEEKFVDPGVNGDGVKKDVLIHIPNVVAKQENDEYSLVHVVDVDTQKKSSLVFNEDSDVHTQFDRASQFGNELAKILEVGKLPHNRKHQVPSKMLNVFTPSLALPSANLDMDVDLLTKSNNLSSTLHKLYLWENKLFDQVKIEEKMRLLHEEKKRRLSRLDEKGAEPHKIDATRTFVRSLSTKIRIAIQVVDKISEKINNLRDEELWPQLNDLLEGLTVMWRSMLECHHSQCEAISAAKRIDAIASHKDLSDASMEATLQLEHELLNWAIRFSCWFGAQKGFVRALNEWLLKCLMYEPEETVDGPVPFSPGRIGAPPIFIVCNQWAQAMQRISDKEVVDSMRDFAMTVLQLWEQDKVEMRQRMVVDKNMGINLDKEDQKIHKELQMLDKMIVVASGDDKGMSLGHAAVFQSETSKNGSLQIIESLQRVFESMERFTATLLKAYEELLQRIQEDKLAQ